MLEALRSGVTQLFASGQPQVVPLVWLHVTVGTVVATAALGAPHILWRLRRGLAPLARRAALGMAAFLIIAIGFYVPFLVAAWSALAVQAPALALFGMALAGASGLLWWGLLPRLLPSSTELRAAYRALSQRHRELTATQQGFRVLVETAAEGVWMLDATGATTFANAAMSEMLGYETLIGRNAIELVFEHDQPTVRRLLAVGDAAVTSTHRCECRLKRRDGSAIFVMLSIAVVPNRAPDQFSVCVMVSDISEREQMARQLQQLNLELGQRVENRTRELEETNRELAREMVVREYVQAELAASNDRLNHYLQALRDHAEDIRQLNLLSDALHSCDSAAAMVPVLERFCAGFFNTQAGALFHLQGDELVKVGGGWGDIEAIHDDVAVPVRLALRHQGPLPSGLAQQGREGPWLLAIPLHARGGNVGVLALSSSQPFWTGDPATDQNQQQVIRALAEHVALASYNLGLLERLREQSFSDPLTGLYNRRYLSAQVEREIAAWDRSNQPFALMLIDIDHFKQVNDLFGHDAGDEALKMVARVILAQTRKTDTCCRLGGEEFVVLLPGAGQELALERAELVREAVRSAPIPGLPAGHILSISLGVAVYPSHGGDMPALLRAADQALYRSKRTGRNRTSVARG